MKKVRLLVSLVLMTVMITVLLTACAEPSDTPPVEEEPKGPAEDPGPQTLEKEPEEEPEDPIAGKRLAVAHISKYDEWCAAVSDEFETQAIEMGFAEINVQDGNLDHETQLRQVENFITQEYDMILIDPVNPEGIIEALEKANDAGIPVIAFDSSIEWDKLVSYVAWDHAATAVMMGQYVKDYIVNELGGKANVVILNMLQFTHTSIRAETFKEQLAELGDNVKYIAEQDFQGNREVAANIISNIKEPIDVIYSVVDNGAWGAVSALEAMGVEGPKVFSAGAYGSEPFDALKANHPYYHACVAVPPANIVKDTLDIAVMYFKGETDQIPKRKNIDIEIYDASNIAEHY